MGSTGSTRVAGKRLLLVDGSALLYRSYFAFIRNPLRSSKGEPTSASFGVLNTLLPVLEEHHPDRLAIVFDTAAPTFRHRQYPEYKAHRPPIPEDLVIQIPRVRALLEAWGIPLVEQEGVEADDLIGSLAREAERAGGEVWILTGDKDFYQLVSDRVRLISPRGRGDQHVHIDRVAVQERFGVPPERMVDLLALMGDASDNVPGVPGVGEKTAAQLIGSFGSLEEIYRSLDRVERKSLREKLRLNEAKARLSQRLVTIRSDLPLDRHWHELTRGRPDRQTLLRILDELELRSMRKRFAAELPQPSEELFAGGLQGGRGTAMEAEAGSGEAPAAEGELFRTMEGRPPGRPALGDYRLADSRKPATGSRSTPRPPASIPSMRAWSGSPSCPSRAGATTCRWATRRGRTSMPTPCVARSVRSSPIRIGNASRRTRSMTGMCCTGSACRSGTWPSTPWLPPT
jgi:5'-3' exonuclease